MKRAFAKRTIRLATLLVILSIIGLTLTSFLPWISVEEDESVKEKLNFNREMMEKSDNEQIKNFAGHLKLINILYWLLIIFGLVFIVGIIIHATGKYPSIAPIMMLVGLENLVVSILILILQIFFIKGVFDSNSIHLSSMATGIYYAYIPLIFGILLLINAINYTNVAVLPLISLFKRSSKEKKPAKKAKKKVKQKTKEVAKTQEKKPQEDSFGTVAIPVTDKKRDEMEGWLTGQMQKIDKTNKNEVTKEPEPIIEEEIEKTPEEQKPIEKIEEIKEDEMDENIEPSVDQEEPIIDEPKKEIQEPQGIENIEEIEKNETEEYIEETQLEENKADEIPHKSIDENKEEKEPASPPKMSFESALSAAIQKKQMEKQNDEPQITKSDETNKEQDEAGLNKKDETSEAEKIPENKIDDNEALPEISAVDQQENKEEDKKNIHIKCPECGHKFSFELGENIKKIKCPNCGKEGVLE